MPASRRRPALRPLAAGHPAGPGGHVRRLAFIEDPDRSGSGALARPYPSAEELARARDGDGRGARPMGQLCCP